MNKLDKQYTDLLQTILEHGVNKKDRTGTGTISVFGRQIRHNMKDGFPLLTTKKMPFKTIVTELLWFLRGDTNIKYLLQNGCHIWTGDAKKRYDEHFKKYWGETENRESKFKPIPNEEFEKRILEDDEFAKKWGELGPIYGKQWRKWELPNYSVEHVEYGFDNDLYVDQIQNLINELKTNPDSRRLMVNAWNVGELDQMVLPPCHYGFQVYTRELSYDEKVHEARKRFGFELEDGTRTFDINTKESIEFLTSTQRAISLMWNQRSVDTFLGLPFNIASYGLLLEIIAKEANMIPDELIGNLGDVHLYSNHLEQAKKQIDREPMKLPSICLDYRDGEYDKNLTELTPDDIVLFNYHSHPTIKAPLSN
ncbi:thymidylate synthase [bacterium]|nr:thymidylate synthase [bacterium]